MSFLVEDVTTKIDSIEPNDYFVYLGFRSKDPRRPKRAGYCIGYLLAKKLHSRIAMPSLIRLEGPALRGEMLATLPTLP